MASALPQSTATATGDGLSAYSCSSSQAPATKCFKSFLRSLCPTCAGQACLLPQATATIPDAVFASF